MTVTQQIITVAAVVAGTVFTRAIAFMLFPAGKETPEYVKYLGKVLPSAVLAMLVIYCYKDIDFMSASRGLPELIAGGFVVLLQFVKKNMLLSIAAGTILYMVLVQVVFV